MYADSMPTPGANSETQLPVFVNQAAASLPSVEATDTALAALAGDWPQASLAALPADVTTSTPSAVSASTAELIAWLVGPPKLITAIAVRLAFIACWAMYAMPANTVALLPAPVQSKTRTGWSVAHGATPNDVPATMPAT